MKTKITTLVLILISTVSYGQWVDPGNDGTGDIYYNNGNVGIGTSTPTSALDIKTSSGSLKIAALGSASSKISSTAALGLETTSTSFIQFLAGGTEIGRFTNQGQLGIGITSPTAKLYVQDNSGFAFGTALVNTHNSGHGVLIQGGGTGGTRYILQLKNAAGDNKMTIHDTGEVGIGTITPTHMLEVNGTIRSKEIKVEASPWPDYVFSDEYKLSSLEETASFIEENHHLPGIPSAQDVEANGVSLGEMNRLLLQKVEELTLHLIEMQEKNAVLENRMTKLENQ